MSITLTTIPNKGNLQDRTDLAASVAFLQEILSVASDEFPYSAIGTPDESGALLQLDTSSTPSTQHGLAAPVYLWVFALSDSEDVGTLIFSKTVDGFAFADAYALNNQTAGDKLGQKSFWASGWTFFCDQEAYVLPQAVTALLDGNETSGHTYADKQIQMSAGLNLLHQWTLESALPLFDLGPFAHLVGDQELLLLANEQPSGMLFTLLLDKISTPLDAYLNKFLVLSSVSFSIFHSFESELFATTYATLSAQASFLEQPCILETSIPLSGDSTSLFSLEIFPQAPLSLTKQDGQNEGLSSLLQDLGIGTDLHIPADFPTLDLAVSFLKIDLGDGGLQRVALELHLDLNEDGNDPGYEVVADLFVLYGIALQVEWMKGSGISFVVAGAMNALSYDFFLSFAYPSMVVQGELAPGEKTAKSIESLAAEVGFPKEVGTALAGVGTAFDISMFADIDDKQLEIVLRNHAQWKLLNFVELDSLELQLLFYNSWGFSGASLYTELRLPIGKQSSDEEERDAVIITVDAEFDADDKLWTFHGMTGPGQPIAVGEAIEGLIAKLGGDAPAEQLPEFVKSLAVQNISVYFDSQGTVDFACETILYIEEQELDFWVHLKRSDQDGLQLVASLFINGFQLAVGFARSTAADNHSDTTLVGSLQTPIKIDSTDLIRAISPSLADDVPISVRIELLGLLLAMHSGSGKQGTQLEAQSGAKATTQAKQQAQREYLFRLLFDLNFGLDGLPLVGKMLEDVRFKDGQLLAANRDWQNDDISAVNDLLTIIEPPPPPIGTPQQTNATVGVGKGITLSGSFQITDDLGFPLFLQFGGDRQQKQLADKRGGKKGGKQSEANAPKPAQPQTGKPDARSQSKIDKVVGAVRIKKVGLIFENGRIGVKITGGLALAVFEFDLIGMQVTVPQSVLDDPSDLTEIDFALDGFAAEIRKGTLSIMGAFLRQHFEEYSENGELIAYDEFSGIIQLSFPPFSLTGMGSYAMYDDHPSLFLFVALGFPITIGPVLVIEGLALGFGIHRDFIPPELDEVLTYPLVAVAVTPPPDIDIVEMVKKLHDYFPPAADLYFVVVGVKFKAFALVDSLVMVAVKFGREFELTLIGVSSVLLPAVFIELVWMARFVPKTGYLFIGGQLTERSYLLVPEVHLTGGFAVAVWGGGPHKGDFVVSVGGYHPHFSVPDHYPNHIPRLGISFHLGPADLKGGVYFAITPQCVMMGAFLEASVKQGALHAFIKLAFDAIIYFQPFHYDVMISADAGVKVDIPLALTTLHINVHLHLDVHIWGPEFNGTASIDVGPKTFDVEIGEGASPSALPLQYETFKEKFLSTVCTVSVTEGLVRKAEENGIEIYVVDAEKVVIEARSTIPITAGGDERLGITPMDVRGNDFTAKHNLRAGDGFKAAEIEEAVPTGIWGGAGLQEPNLGDPASGLVPDVHTGYRLRPGAERETSESHAIKKEKLAFNTDVFTLKDRSVAVQMVEHNRADVQEPAESYFDYTGLHLDNISQIDSDHPLPPNLLTYAMH